MYGFWTTWSHLHKIDILTSKYNQKTSNHGVQKNDKISNGVKFRRGETVVSNFLRLIMLSNLLGFPKNKIFYSMANFSLICVILSQFLVRNKVLNIKKRYSFQTQKIDLFRFWTSKEFQMSWYIYDARSKKRFLTISDPSPPPLPKKMYLSSLIAHIASSYNFF